MTQQAQPNQPKISPKLKQFTEEIQEVCDRYQYVLSPQLQYTPQGITPTIKVSDKLPEKPAPKAKKKAAKKKKK